jgi:hypothetical protein
VSHEILATASPQQVRRAVDSLAVADAELHVVLSARDLVRQIPAEWQENVKHRRTVAYRDFLDKITDPSRQGALASWFWGVQEVPDILVRWGADLPPERVHLVTVPRPGAPRDLLWQRFQRVLGLGGLLDEDAVVDARRRANPSLGVNETALIRRVNERVNQGVLVGDDYRDLVRELLAHRTLSQRRRSARLGLPDDVRAWAVDLSEAWVEELAERGYDVVGSLDDLRPDPHGTEALFVDPDHPDEDAVSEAALDSIVALLSEVARLRESERRLGHELAEALDELERSRGLWFRVKRRLVRAADDNWVAGLGLAVYRRLRGRSSRSA